MMKNGNKTYLNHLKLFTAQILQYDHKKKFQIKQNSFHSFHKPEYFIKVYFYIYVFFIVLYLSHFLPNLISVCMIAKQIK